MADEATGASRFPGRAERDRELFDEIASRYAAKDEHAAARVARRRRLEATWLLADPAPDCAIWEVGCGAGYAARYLRGRYREYRGTDRSAKLVAAARARHDLPGVTFETGDFLLLRPDPPPDVVLVVGVLHHLQEPRHALTHLLDCLAPGGWLVANEPLRGNPFVRLLRGFRKRVDPRYSDEQTDLSRREVESFLRAASLREVRLRPQGLLSTPLAEVPLGPVLLTRPTARALVAVERWVETRLPAACWPLAWNVAFAART